MLSVDRLGPLAKFLPLHKDSAAFQNVVGSLDVGTISGHAFNMPESRRL